MQIDGQVLAALEAYAKGGARAADLASVLARASYRLFDDAERLRFRRLQERIDKLLTNDDVQSRANILALLTELGGQYPRQPKPGKGAYSVTRITSATQIVAGATSKLEALAVADQKPDYEWSNVSCTDIEVERLSPKSADAQHPDVRVEDYDPQVIDDRMRELGASESFDDDPDEDEEEEQAR